MDAKLDYEVSDQVGPKLRKTKTILDVKVAKATLKATLGRP